MTNIEQRTIKQSLEIRSNQPNSMTIGGYAAKFGRPSHPLPGGFIERIDRRAFNKSRGDGWPNVVCRWNHKDSHLIGTTAGGTLRLAVDDTGLDYTVDVPRTQAYIAELVERGDVKHSSFAFQIFDEDWSTTDGGVPLRTVVSCLLIDVAPVTTPAYADTSVAMRSLAKHVGAPIEDVAALANTQELRKLFVRTDIAPAPAVVPKPTPGAPSWRLQYLKRVEKLDQMDPRPKPPTSGRDALLDIMGKRWPATPKPKYQTRSRHHLQLLQPMTAQCPKEI